MSSDAIFQMRSATSTGRMGRIITLAAARISKTPMMRASSAGFAKPRCAYWARRPLLPMRFSQPWPASSRKTMSWRQRTFGGGLGGERNVRANPRVPLLKCVSRATEKQQSERRSEISGALDGFGERLSGQGAKHGGDGAPNDEPEQDGTRGETAAGSSHTECRRYRATA